MAKTTIPRDLMTCPACGKTVTGYAVFEIGELFDQPGSKVVKAVLTMKGLKIEHSCIPFTPREQTR